MRQTTMLKPSEVVRTWYVVDATDATLGRLSTKVATVLRGKHKPTYTPNVDCGDYVIVINADKVKISGDQDLRNSTIHIHSGQMVYVLDPQRLCVNSTQLNG